MKDYKSLAVRYLKMNKKRCIVTVLGVTAAVTVLYLILNLGWCTLLNQREMLRKQQDYEIVFLTENQSQIEQIMADAKIKNASVGPYYAYSYDNPKMYENALYINTTSPYRMNSILEAIQSKYGVEGELNTVLAATYLQGREANLMVIIISFVLLISFVFAIFGVGIVRNSIQLSILEQIRDYGNLRCIGASRSQLKAVVYLEGMLLELTGNGIGIALGWLGTLTAGHFLQLETGFHFVPIIPILIAFLGDLYFAMEENCKVITNLTPISAIRGEYRIRKEKFKFRRKSIFAKLFGVEGDYAYKSIMRNPGRFYKTVWSIGIGVAAFIAMMGMLNTSNGIVDEITDRYKYFHVYFEDMLETDETIYDVQSSIPSASDLQEITDMNEVTEAKRMYSSKVILADWEANYEHYTEEYLTKTIIGGIQRHQYSSLKGNGDGKQEQIHIWEKNLSEINCYGYDEEDYSKYQAALIDGTLEVSENGLVLINRESVAASETSETLLEVVHIEVSYTDYKIGDTIDIVDMTKLRAMAKPRLMKLKEEYEKQKEVRSTPKKEGEKSSDTTENDLENEYEFAKREIVAECRQNLIEEGDYKTYTIEGIVQEDVLLESRDEMTVILPLENYYSFTGTDKSMVTGMQYHFDKFPAIKYRNIVESWETFDDWYGQSAYPEILSMIESMKNSFRGFMLFVLFIVMMTTFNIINTTAGNLHLRRREFAQLRVIGISRKHLMKLVMLEGVITSVAANIIGIVLGTAVGGGYFGYFFRIVFGAEYKFPYIAAVLGIFLSTLLLCGCIYIPLKEMKQNIASDLSTGGD